MDYPIRINLEFGVSGQIQNLRQILEQVRNIRDLIPKAPIEYFSRPKFAGFQDIYGSFAYFTSQLDKLDKQLLKITSSSKEFNRFFLQPKETKVRFIQEINEVLEEFGIKLKPLNNYYLPTLKDWIEKSANAINMLKNNLEGITFKRLPPPLHPVSLPEPKDVSALMGVMERLKSFRPAIFQEIKEQVLDVGNLLKNQPIYIEALNKKLEGSKTEWEKINIIASHFPKEVSNIVRGVREKHNYLYRARLEWDRIANTARILSYYFIGAIAGIIRSTTHWVNSLMQVQGALQLTGRETVAFQYLANSLGISFKELTTTTNNIYQALINAGQGTSFVAERVREALSSVGLSAKKLGEDMGRSPEVLIKVVRALEKLEQRYGRTWVMQKLLGSNMEEVSALLTIGSRKIEEILSKGEAFAQGLGLNFSEVYGKVVLLNQTITELSMAFKAKLLDILPSIVNALKSLSSIVLKLIGIFGKYEWLAKFTGYFMVLVPLSGQLIFWLEKIWITFIRIKEVLPTVFLNLKAILFTNFNPFIFALTTISALIVGLAFKVRQWANAHNQAIKQANQEWRKRAVLLEKYSAEETETIAKAISARTFLFGEERKGLDNLLEKYRRNKIIVEELEKKKRQAEAYGVSLSEKEQDRLERAKVAINEVIAGVSKYIDLVDVEISKRQLTKSQIEETERLIKEQNLSLVEQYKIWTDLLSKASEKSEEQELVLKNISQLLKEVGQNLENYNKWVSGMSIPKDLNEIIEIQRKWEEIKPLKEIILDLKVRKPDLGKVREQQYVQAEIQTSKVLNQLLNNLHLNAVLSRLKAERTALEAEEKLTLKRRENLYKDLNLLEQEYQADRLKISLDYENEIANYRIQANEQLNLWKQTKDEKYLNTYIAILDTIKEKERTYSAELKTLDLKRLIDRNNIITKYAKDELDTFKDLYEKEISLAREKSEYLDKTDLKRIENQKEIISITEKYLLTLNYLKDKYKDNADFQKVISDEIIKTEKELSKEYISLAKTTDEVNREVIEKRLKYAKLYELSSLELYNLEMKLLSEREQRALTTAELESIRFEKVSKTIEREKTELLSYLNLLKVLTSFEITDLNFKLNSYKAYFDALNKIRSQNLISESDYINRLKNSFESLINSFLKNEQYLLEIGKREDFYKEWSSIISLLKTNISDVMTSASYGIETKRDLLISFIEDIINSLRQSGLSFVDIKKLFETSNLNQVFIDLATSAGLSTQEVEILKQSLGKLPELIGQLKLKPEEFLQLGKFQEFLEALGYYIQDFVKIVRESITSIDFGSLSKGFYQFIYDVFSGSKTLKDALVNLKDFIYKSFMEMFIKLTILPKIFTQEVLDMLNQAITIFVQGSIKQSSYLISQSTYLIDKVIQKVVSSIELFAPLVEEVSNTLRNRLGIIGKDIENSSEYISRHLQNVGKSLFENISETTQETVETLSDFVETSNNILSRLGESRERVFSRLGRFRRWENRNFGFIQMEPSPVVSGTTTENVNQNININFHGLSFEEQRKVFQLTNLSNRIKTLTI